MMSKFRPLLHADIGVLTKALVKRTRQRMVWASDWPHALPTASDGAMQPDGLLDWAPDQVARERIHAGSPAQLHVYGRV